MEHPFQTEVVELEKTSFKNPLVIGGFFATGFTGSVAVTYIVEELGLKEIAHVRSPHIPPVVVFIDGELRHPFRIYRNESGTLVAIVCEVPIDLEGLYETSNVLLYWLEKIQPREIVILDPIPIKGIPLERHTYCAANEKRIQELKKFDIASAESALIGGIAGSILSECLTRKVPAMSLLTEVSVSIPDPAAVLTFVKALNSAYNLAIDTKELEQSVSELKENLSDMIQQYQKLQSSQGETSKPKQIYE